MVLLILCIFVLLVLILVGVVYVHISNGLVMRRNRVKQCRSGICVVIKQRNDLIPNLIASVKAYMGHENDVLTRIVELRSKGMGDGVSAPSVGKETAPDIADGAASAPVSEGEERTPEAEGHGEKADVNEEETTEAEERRTIAEGAETSRMFHKIKLMAEQYPTLQADERFSHLESQMVDMEEEIQAMRRTYNAAVNDYNNHIEMFPHSIVASIQRHRPEQLIEIPQEELHDVNAKQLFES